MKIKDKLESVLDYITDDIPSIIAVLIFMPFLLLFIICGLLSNLDKLHKPMDDWRQ